MTQTVFPGVEVESIFIIKNVIEEDGTLGAAETFGDSLDQDNILQNNYITRTVRKFYKDRLGERDALAYELSVKATNSKSAEIKAKAFVRLKNPFEPTLIAISNVQEIEGEGLVKTYAVGVPVIKSGLLGDL